MDGTFGLVTTTLLLAVALGVGALRVLKRRVADGPLRVTARVGLDTRRALYLVEIEGRRLVVGAGEGGMTLLTELRPDAPAVDSSVEARN